MPRVKVSSSRPREARSRALLLGDRDHRTTPFITMVIFFGEIPPSVRFSAVAGLTAMIRSA